MTGYKHGYAATRPPEYETWVQMCKRCRSKAHKSYPSYGGRGIAVCDRWSDFDNFYADMGPRPDGMTLERMDNDGNYAPDNCKWATSIEQQRNKRTNIFVEIGGITRCVSEWCQLFGVRRGTVCERMRRGISAVEALTTPVETRIRR